MNGDRKGARATRPTEKGGLSPESRLSGGLYDHMADLYRRHFRELHAFTPSPELGLSAARQEGYGANAKEKPSIRPVVSVQFPV